MSALAPVRDWDVLLQAVDRTPGVATQDAARLRAAVGRRRDRAAGRMGRHLDGMELRVLRADLEGTCGRDGGSHAPLAAVAPSRVMRAVEQALVVAPRWEETDDASLHEARKAVKRLRYALEAFQPGFGRTLARMMERCRELQEAFGAVQDAATFAVRLRTVRTFAAGQTLAHAQATAGAQRSRLPRLWERALGARMLGRLASHLARRAARPLVAPTPAAPVALLPSPPAQAAS
jgi:CHAD domain-containing protein